MCTDINKMSKWKVSQCFFLLLCNKLPQIQQFITTPIYYFMLLWVRSTGGLSWCSVQSHNFIVVLARLGSELETLGKSFPPGSFRLLSSQKIINKDTEKTRSSSHRRPSESRSLTSTHRMSPNGQQNINPNSQSLLLPAGTSLLGIIKQKHEIV